MGDSKLVISQKTQLEIKIKDQNHTYHCPANATLLECFDALNTFRAYIFGRIKELEEEVKAKEKIKEEPKPEGA